MANRLTDTEIWVKAWYGVLTPEQKLFWRYLCDNCNIAGIWSPNWPLVKFHCWIEGVVDPKVFGQKEDGLDRITLLPDGKWFINGFIEFQQKVNSIKELNPKNNAHLGIIRVLTKEGLVSPCVAPEVGLTSPPGKGKGKSIGKGKEGGVGETGKPFQHPPPPEFLKLKDKIGRIPPKKGRDHAKRSTPRSH